MTDTSTNIIHRQSACLCPNCDASTLTISTSAFVSYNVTYDESANELVVVGESIGDSEWDLNSRASCPQCQWQGTLEHCLKS